MTERVSSENPSTGSGPASALRQDSRRGVAFALAAIAGMLAAFLAMELGIGDVLGDVPLQLVVGVGAVGGLVCAAARRVVMIVAIDALLLAAFVLVADTPLIASATAAWVRNDSLPARVDAIVVPSSNVNSGGSVNDEAAARLLSAVELFQRGIAPRIVTTIVAVKFGEATRTSEADQERLVTLGGARSAWSWVKDVHDTHDEATQVAVHLSAAGKTVALVTSPMHTRRACATFEAVGFKVVCVASREQEFQTWHPRTARERVKAFREYLYERLGMVKYHFTGWIAR